MNGDPPIDDTAICPACDGSGMGVADTLCGFCGGCGGIPLAALQQWENERRRWEGAMVRFLTGTGEFDTNDPCDEWPVP